VSDSTRVAEFIELWTANARQVSSFIYSLLPHWADADDVLQETARIVWEKFDQFQTGTNFNAWACQIAYHRALDFRKRKGGRHVLFSDAFLSAVQEELAAEQPVMNQRAAALVECIEKLSEQNRRLVRGRYEEGTTVQSLAQHLGRTVDAVYKSLNRIHQVLLVCIDRTVQRENR
jgi:RNA polymerase sigma-70 factor, ECF subfamily